MHQKEQKSESKCVRKRFDFPLAAIFCLSLNNRYVSQERVDQVGYIKILHDAL